MAQDKSVGKPKLAMLVSPTTGDDFYVDVAKGATLDLTALGNIKLYYPVQMPASVFGRFNIVGDNSATITFPNLLLLIKYLW